MIYAEVERLSLFKVIDRRAPLYMYGEVYRKVQRVVTDTHVYNARRYHLRGDGKDNVYVNGNYEVELRQDEVEKHVR